MTCPVSESVVPGTVSILFSAVTQHPTQDLRKRHYGGPRKWQWNMISRRKE